MGEQFSNYCWYLIIKDLYALSNCQVKINAKTLKFVFVASKTQLQLIRQHSHLGIDGNYQKTSLICEMMLMVLISAIQVLSDLNVCLV